MFSSSHEQEDCVFRRRMRNINCVYCLVSHVTGLGLGRREEACLDWRKGTGGINRTNRRMMGYKWKKSLSESFTFFFFRPSLDHLQNIECVPVNNLSGRRQALAGKERRHVDKHIEIGFHFCCTFRQYYWVLVQMECLPSLPLSSHTNPYGSRKQQNLSSVLTFDQEEAFSPFPGLN